MLTVISSTVCAYIRMHITGMDLCIHVTAMYVRMCSIVCGVCVSAVPLAQDFQPGKEYRRTLQLTNISYTVNTCKMVGLTEELKDFVTIQ